MFFFLEILDVQRIFLWYIQVTMEKQNFLWSGFAECNSENLQLLFSGIFYIEDKIFVFFFQAHIMHVQYMERAVNFATLAILEE